MMIENILRELEKFMEEVRDFISSQKADVEKEVAETKADVVKEVSETLEPTTAPTDSTATQTSGS